MEEQRKQNVASHSLESEFVSYEQAVALKELGFNEPCLRGWDKDNKIWYHPDSDIIVDNPLKSQVFRFFREKYGLHIGICHQANNKFDCWTNGGYLLENGKYCDFDTYEEAESSCINKLIELAKQQSK